MPQQFVPASHSVPSHGGSMHCPLRQKDCAPVQLVSQEPQFVGSLKVFTQTPPQQVKPPQSSASSQVMRAPPLPPEEPPAPAPLVPPLPSLVVSALPALLVVGVPPLPSPPVPPFPAAVEDPPPAELPLLSALDALVPDVVLSLLVLFESVAALVLDVPPAEFVVPSLPEPDPSLEPQPRTDSAKANQLL
jgi:hypothetical protein